MVPTSRCSIMFFSCNPADATEVAIEVAIQDAIEVGLELLAHDVALTAPRTPVSFDADLRSRRTIEPR